MTRRRLAIALDDQPACPACELGEEHTHRTRRSPNAPACQWIARASSSRRSGAPSLPDPLLAALVALADVVVLGLLALLVMEP